MTSYNDGHHVSSSLHLHCICATRLTLEALKMTWGETYQMPLNVYIAGLGVGLFLFVLTVIWFCVGSFFLFCRLRRYKTREHYEYNEVTFKISKKKLEFSITSQFLKVTDAPDAPDLPLQQMCAVCLEEFRMRDQLALCPCSHTFHTKCLLKWLEIRSLCPMCNKPVYKVPLTGPQDIINFQVPQDL
uniref:Si:dkey-51a16.9 n=1 Tax=Paramormyrops kingsleyae TaxID=1676925 RepID=A0A3B3RBG6_9TELE